MEATSDCRWTDVDRTEWFSWFLTGLAKVTWQKNITSEDKISWEKIVSVFRGQFGVHMDLRTAYQHCHELQYDSFGSGTVSTRVTAIHSKAGKGDNKSMNQ